MKAETSYTDEVALRICTRLAEGEPLTKQCKDDDMPSLSSVYRWLRENAEFRVLYETARQDMAHTLADDILAISDEAPLVVEVEGQQIAVKLDMAAVQRNRQRLDARKWVASKLFPRKFGDKLAVGGADDLPPLGGEEVPTLELARRVAFLLAKADHELAERRQAQPLALAYVHPVGTD